MLLTTQEQTAQKTDNRIQLVCPKPYFNSGKFRPACLMVSKLEMAALSKILPRHKRCLSFCLGWSWRPQLKLSGVFAVAALCRHDLPRRPLGVVIRVCVPSSRMTSSLSLRGRIQPVGWGLESPDLPIHIFATVLKSCICNNGDSVERPELKFGHIHFWQENYLNSGNSNASWKNRRRFAASLKCLFLSSCVTEKYNCCHREGKITASIILKNCSWFQ